MGTRLFFSGGESIFNTKELIANGVEHIQYSHFWMTRGRREHFFANAILQNPQIKFILEAGPEYEKKDPGDLEEYRDSYVTFLQNYGHLCHGVAEFCVDGSVSLQKQQIWLQEMISRFPNVMPVWRHSRGFGAWEEYCKNASLSLLAVDSSVTDIGLMMRLVNLAHKHGKKVHRFGHLNFNEILKYVQFDSMGQRKWLAAGDFGHSFIFRANKFISISKTDVAGKSTRRLYKTYFEEIGCSWEKIEKEDLSELRKAGIIAWRNFSGRVAATHWARPLEGIEMGKDGSKEKNMARNELGSKPESKHDAKAPPDGLRSAPSRLGGSPKAIEGRRVGVVSPREARNAERVKSQALAVSPVPKLSLSVEVEEDEHPSETLAKAANYDPKRALELAKLGIIPQMACSVCFISTSCPEYKEGMTCAFNKAFKAFDVREVDTIELLMEEVVNRNKERFMRGALSEELLSGGQLDMNVSKQSELLMKQLTELRNLKKATRKTTYRIDESAPGQGILSQLFGGSKKPERVIEVIPERKKE